MATTDLTSGSAQDAIKALLQTSYDRSNDLFGKSEGLSPQALSAFRTEATSGIQDQYDSAARALTSELLRRGAVGQGALPSSAGDISRTFQPLYTAREAAKTKAQRDTILADEAAKRESLQQNNALSMTALGTAGNFANTLADIEPASMKNLLLTALLSGAAAPGGGLAGNLISGTGTNDTGNHGIIGDLLGKIPGTGSGGSTGSPINLDSIISGITNGDFGGTAPYVGTPTETAGQAAAQTAPETARLLAEILGPAAATALTGGIAGAGTIASGIGTPSIIGQIGTTAAEAAAPSGSSGIAGALGLGGGEGLLGLGALTIPVIGGVALAIGLLAKKYWGNGPDRMAANQLTGPGGVHEFFNQATAQAEALPEGPERDSAYNVRDRAMEQALLGFSRIDKDHYYQAKQTLRQFSQFSTVQPLLG